MVITSVFQVPNTDFSLCVVFTDKDGEVNITMKPPLTNVNYKHQNILYREKKDLCNQAGAEATKGTKYIYPYREGSRTLPPPPCPKKRYPEKQKQSKKKKNRGGSGNLNVCVQIHAVLLLNLYAESPFPILDPQAFNKRPPPPP